jgi:hypothetical protein
MSFADMLVNGSGILVGTYAHWPTSGIGDLAAPVKQLRGPLVFDHLDQVPTRISVDNRRFQNLPALLRERLVWVRLSASYRSTRLDAILCIDTRPSSTHRSMQIFNRPMVSERPHVTISGPYLMTPLEKKC